MFVADTNTLFRKCQQQQLNIPMRITEFINPILSVLHRNMLLEEPIGTAIVSRDWREYDLGGKPDDDFKILGRIGKYKIGIQSEWNDSIDYAVDALIVDSTNKIVGKVNLVSEERRNRNIKFWTIHMSLLHRSLQGRGLMPKVYAFLVNHGYNLRADGEQSAGGQNIWAKLSKDPTVSVYAALYDEKTGKIEYSDVEGIKQLQANFYLYNDEMVEELKYIENEIESLRDIRDRINDDYNDIPADASDSEVEEKLSKEWETITNKIGELELEYSKLKQQHREEARKEMYLVAIPAKKSDTVTESRKEQEEAELELVKKDGMLIMYMHNPSEAVQLAAVKENPFAIHEIENVKSKAVVLTAILAMIKTESLINAKGLAKDFKQRYPDWPEWAVIDRSIKALRK